jgi:Putative transposase
MAQYAGFSLHAGIGVEAGHREKSERLARYVSRPPVSVERIALRAQGQVRYRSKTPYPAKRDERSGRDGGHRAGAVGARRRRASSGLDTAGCSLACGAASGDHGREEEGRGRQRAAGGAVRGEGRSVHRSVGALNAAAKPGVEADSASRSAGGFGTMAFRSPPPMELGPFKSPIRTRATAVEARYLA